MNSYIGVTLLPAIHKLLEHCIFDRMKQKMNSIKFPPSLQYAAQKGSDCVLVSYCVQEMILNMTEKAEKCLWHS